MSSMSLAKATRTAGLALVPSLFFWAFWVCFSGPGRRLLRTDLRKDDDKETEAALVLLEFVALVAIGMGLVYVSRAGCERNLLLEAFTASATLSSAMFIRWISGPGRSRLLAAVALLLILATAAMPGLQLLFFNRIGILTLASSKERRLKEVFAQCLQDAPKPLLSDDEMFSLPWLSTGGQYPAYVVSWDLYGAARRRGLVSAGIDDLIVRHRFGSVLLAENDGLYRQALASGYRYSPPAPCPGWQDLRLLLLQSSGAGVSPAVK